jgi:four helix bundle protein
MNSTTLIASNKKFVLGVVEILDQMPRTYAFDAFSRQLIRCSSSVGANYRAACRAKSEADFINKLKIVEEEADESIYFLDLIRELYEGSALLKIEELLKEADELLAIYVASIVTMRKKQMGRKNQKS